jgi:hypothetical protein
MTFISDSGTGNPVFDYSSRDYASVFADLENRIPVYLPEWTSQSNSDFGIVLLQMYAYVCDLLGYYEDRIAGEAFIQTATQAVSILNLAAMLDYQPTLSVGSTVTLYMTISPAITGPLTIPAGSIFSTQSSTTNPAVLFQTTTALTIAGSGGTTPSLAGSVVATQGLTYTSLPSANWAAFGVPIYATVVPQVATSDGTINQTYPLQYSPVSAGSCAVYVDLGTGPQEWTYEQTLINSGPYDLVYTAFVDANAVFYVIFGDGVNGLVPPLGSPVYATYQTNVGLTGNVGSGTITVPVTSIVGLTAVTNQQAASGGANAESLQSIQTNAPASLKTLNRAVTISDYSTLALQISGVQWASAIEQTYQLVNLYICPFGGGTVSSLLNTTVDNTITAQSMANTSVTVFSPTYVAINVTATVVVYDNYSDSATQAVIQSALQNLLSLSNTGFGFRVSLGLVYQTILAQAGVNYAIVTSLTRGVTSTLTTALANSTGYTTLYVTQLPTPITAGDSITLNTGGVTTQIVTVAVPAAAGSTQIAVSSFTANGNYPIGTPVQDTTGVVDAATLANEIPIAGTFTINVSGGLA